MAVRVRQPDFVRRRIERFFFVVAVCYLALVGRLVWLQAVNGAYYRHRAGDMRTQHIEMPAERGAILDRNGKPMAVTTHSGVLVCDPTQVKNPARTAAAVARLLDTGPESILPLVTTRNEKDHFAIVRKGLGPETVETFRKMRGSKEWARDLEALALQDHAERAYPVGRDAVHVVGFMNPDPKGILRGQMGLERSLDTILRGRNGYVKAEVDAHRRVIPDTQVERQDPVDGPDVRLTLDSNIQHIVETELADCYRKYRPAGATAIVYDPRTGDILSLVSYPDFDPVTREELKHDREPLRDRALMPYEPGSTMKPITGSAALESKAISPSTPFYCGGRMPLNGRTIRCVLHGASERYGHGTETILEIIEHSCNIGAAQVGIRLGLQNMKRYLKAFGLLDGTQIGLQPDIPGTLGEGADDPRRSVGKVARVAFGQSVMVTPLALIAAYGAIANDGVLMQPRLVQCYQDAGGRIIKLFPPARVRQVISPQTAAFMRTCLEAVVTSGTGKGKAEIAGYTVAGKTGTAQKVVKGQRGYSREKYVASFIGFVPARNPRAVIAVVVDEPKSSIYGAQVAAPVFQSIGRQLMWYWKVPPDDPGSLLKGRTARR
jgi:stage V sporulation protein D (sporulation-specific penicillin-binding protein)